MKACRGSRVEVRPYLKSALNAGHVIRLTLGSLLLLQAFSFYRRPCWAQILFAGGRKRNKIGNVRTT
jgi:hypothetical protein